MEKCSREKIVLSKPKSKPDIIMVVKNIMSYYEEPKIQLKNVNVKHFL